MNKSGRKALYLSNRVFDNLKKRAKQKGRLLHSSYGDDIVLLGLLAEEKNFPGKLTKQLT